MAIARKLYLFVAALFVFLLAGVPTEVEAQGGGLTCGWCVMDGDVVAEGPGWVIYENVTHAFLGGGR